MRCEDLISQLGYKQETAGDPSSDIKTGYTGDLLSDVMANAEENSCLITIQGHKNSIAVATLIGMPLIILCNGRVPDEDMKISAEKEGIAIVVTDDNQYICSSKIHHLLQS